MKIVTPLASVLALAALVGLSLGTTATSARAAAEVYTVDAAHSFVLFRCKHMDVGYAYGRFNEFSGTVNWDAANPAGSSITVEVQTKSIDTGVVKRDDHLRNPDYFNAPQFPTLTFKSTAAKMVDATHIEVTGDLTLHGKTKPVTFQVEHAGPVKDPWGMTRAGFHAEFEIKRSDFGVGKPEGLSDEVRLTIAFEITKK
jgi:polyisoprenoid-binding protein YceI